jgi:hypothetical protein
LKSLTGVSTGKSERVYGETTFLKALLGIPHIGTASPALVRETLSSETRINVIYHGITYNASGRDVCDYLGNKLGLNNIDDIIDFVTSKVKEPCTNVLRPRLGDSSGNSMPANMLRLDGIENQNGIANFSNFNFGIPWNPIAINVPNPELRSRFLSQVEITDLELGLNKILSECPEHDKTIEWAKRNNSRIVTKVLIVLDDDNLARKLELKHINFIMLLGDGAANLMLLSPVAEKIGIGRLNFIAKEGRLASVMGIAGSPYVGKLSPDVLAHLATNVNADIRAILMGNKNARPYLSKELLMSGMTDYECTVRKASAESFNLAEDLPQSIITNLFNDSERIVWSAACMNPHAILGADEKAIIKIILSKGEKSIIISKTLANTDVEKIPPFRVREFMRLKKQCEDKPDHIADSEYESYLDD